jgi:5-methylcytosine-specific restriction endonuclease McrA
VRPTLLLNANYFPLSIVGSRTAISLWFLDKAQILDAYQERIHSPSFSMALPAVLRLKYHRSVHQPVGKFSRRVVFARDRYVCGYCGGKFEIVDLTIDHVIPRSRGGRTDYGNVITSCIRCNERKKNRTPDEAGMPLLKTPRRPPSDLIMRVFNDRRTIPLQWKKYVFI